MADDGYEDEFDEDESVAGSPAQSPQVASESASLEESVAGSPVSREGKENTPPAPEQQQFSADDDDLEALFHKTPSVSSATAQRGPRLQSVKAKGKKAAEAGRAPAARRKKPPRVKPPKEPAGDEEEMASVDFKAIENDEAAIDRELERITHELRDMSRPKSSNGARTDSGFVPRQRAGARRRVSSAGDAQRRRPASAADATDAELDDELARLQSELKELDSSKSDFEGVGAVAVPRPRTAGELPGSGLGEMSSLRPVSRGRARRRRSAGRPRTPGSAFARSALPAELLRHPAPRRRSAVPALIGPGWDTTPVGRGPNALRPVVLVGCDPHADQEIQMRNRLLGAAAKPRRLPAFTDSGLTNARARSGLEEGEGDGEEASGRAGRPASGASAGGRKKQSAADVEHAEVVTQTGSHDATTHEGMLTVTVIKAEGVLDADERGGGSDPYVRVGLGGQEYITAINRDVEFSHGGEECAWNQTFTLRCAQPHDTLELELYDYDHGDEDDVLGGLMIPASVYTSEDREGWWKIMPPEKMHVRAATEVTSERERREDCRHGCLFLRLSYTPKIWLSPSLSTRATALEQMQSAEQAKAQWVPYGHLHLRIVEAQGLPKLKQLKNTNPFAVVNYGGAHNKTGVTFQSTKPHWDALFSFNVFELRREMTIDVLDFDKMKVESGDFDRLGTVTFSVAEELDGNKRADSWLNLWAEDPQTSAPIPRGQIRVRLEYLPWFPVGGRKGKADSGGGRPERITQEAATLVLTIPRATGLRAAAPERKRHRRPGDPRDSDSDEEAGTASPTSRSTRPANVESDSYCQVSVISAAGDTVADFKTDTCPSSLEPEYDTDIHMNIPLADPHAIIRIDCYHETRPHRRDRHLGGFYLPVAMAMCNGSLWHDDKEEHWFRLEDQPKLGYKNGTKPPRAVLVDGELNRQYNCPNGAVLVRKTFGLEKMEEGMDIGVGRLTVTIIRAKKLPEMKRKKNRPPDSFAVLTYDAMQFETNVINRSSKPSWGEEFSFPITDIRSSFNISLFDNGMTGDHELLGSISVGINEVLRNSALDQQPWYKIFRSNEYGRLRPNGELQLRLNYKPSTRTPGAPVLPTVAAPRTLRSTMRTTRQLRRLAAAVEAAKPKAIKVELTDEQKQQKKEDDARSVLGFMKSPKNPAASLGSSPKRADSGSLELHIERATGLPAYTVCYCKAFIESADGATVGKPAQSIQWSSLSDDDDAVFDFTSNLTMTSAEDYLRVEIVAVQANKAQALAAAGDRQGAEDAAAIHGGDDEKGPPAESGLCGFRVLLSTLKSEEQDEAVWYKLAAMDDLVEAGAVVGSESDETEFGLVKLTTAKQIWRQKSMRSRLGAALGLG